MEVLSELWDLACLPMFCVLREAYGSVAYGRQRCVYHFFTVGLQVRCFAGKADSIIV